ncbi:MAG: DoxX family protein [Vicinamibacterales bacterium]
MTTKLVPAAYSLLRIVAAFVYLLHGLQKFGMFGGAGGGGGAVPLASLFGAAAIIELVAGSLLLVGLFTRPVAFLASGQMAAAYFIAHLPRGPLPIQNGGDAAVLLCFVFLFVWANGSGVWSVDALLKGSSRS